MHIWPKTEDVSAELEYWLCLVGVALLFTDRSSPGVIFFYNWTKWATSIDFSELARRILPDLVETSWEHQQLPQLTSTTILPCNSEITNLGAITASRSGAEYPNFTAHQIQVPEQGGTILLFLTAPAALANSIQAHRPIPLALVPGSVEWVTGQVIATSASSWAPPGLIQNNYRREKECARLVTHHSVTSNTSSGLSKSLFCLQCTDPFILKSLFILK